MFDKILKVLVVISFGAVTLSIVSAAIAMVSLVYQTIHYQ